MITSNSLYIADILSFRITSLSLAFTRFTWCVKRVNASDMEVIRKESMSANIVLLFFCPEERNENQKKREFISVRSCEHFHCLQTLPKCVFFVSGEMKSHVNVALRRLHTGKRMRLRWEIPKVQATSVYDSSGKIKHLCSQRANACVATAATVAIATTSISLLGRVELIAITLGSMNLDSYTSTTIVSCARLGSD